MKEKNRPIFLKNSSDKSFDGMLRLVWDTSKAKIASEKHRVNFIEITQVMFDLGRSEFIKTEQHKINFKGKESFETRYYIIGLTRNGRVLYVIFTVRDNGFQKRIVTAMDAPRKILNKFAMKRPDLAAQINGRRVVINK